MFLIQITCFQHCHSVKIEYSQSHSLGGSPGNWTPFCPPSCIILYSDLYSTLIMVFHLSGIPWLIFELLHNFLTLISLKNPLLKIHPFLKKVLYDVLSRINSASIYCFCHLLVATFTFRES